MRAGVPLLSLVFLFLLALAPGCASPRFPIDALPATEGMEIRDGFSLSPDGSWLLFARVPPPDPGQAYSEDLSLVLVDMRTGEALVSPVPTQALSRTRAELALAADCWTQDGTVCRLPVRRDAADRYVPLESPLIVIDVSGPEPTFRYQSGDGSDGEIRYADLAREFTCSDCALPSLYDDGVELKYALLEQAVGQERATQARREDEFGDASALEPDGKGVYLVEGNGGRTATLRAYALGSAAPEELATFSNLLQCVRVDELRPSPDGAWIALERSDGCTFVSAPDLYVLERSTGKLRLVAEHTYGEVHWSPDSSRLYFYSCAHPGACGERDGLSVASVSTPASS